MIVRKSGEKLLIFAFLISPAKTILCEKCFITRWGTSKFVKKKPAARRIFNSLLTAECFIWS